MTAAKTKAAKARPAARVLAGLREALAHTKGEANKVVIHAPDAVDAKAIRQAQGLSQEAFADRYGLDVSALRDWEQGRRIPDRSARLLLKLISREPKTVQRILAAE
jgi:putative transcriptional regulator